MKCQKILGGLLAAMWVACASASVFAQQVGSKPNLSFTAVSGEKVSLAALRGKIVIVDFWATWCGPCMAEAPHMVATNQKYAGKGLQIIGVSLDQDVNQMTQVAKQQGLTWPQDFDSQNAVATAWGVDSIPRTFVIGPDGTVLWTGHPAELDGPLADAFANHPPQMVDPQVLAAANSTLDDIDKALAAKDAAGALKLAARVSKDAQADTAFAQRWSDIQKKLQDAGQQLIDQVDPLLKSRQYVDAKMKLEDLVKALGDSPLAAKAQAKLTALLADPDARAAIDRAQKEQAATAALAVAQKLAADGKDVAAYNRYKDISRTYPDTSAGLIAAAAVAAYEKDADFMARMKDAAIADQAKSLLSMAENYKNVGKTDMARQKYQAVIDQFPGTRYAVTAQKGLDELGP